MLNSSKKIHRNLSKNNCVDFFYFDYDEHIKNKKKLRFIKELSENVILNGKIITLCNDYLCDNLIYFVASCDEQYYQIDNYSKTKFIIEDINNYINLCINEIYIFKLSQIDLGNYKYHKNDINVVFVESFNYEQLINNKENSFICVGNTSENIINATIYLTIKLWFFIDENLIIFKNVISSLKDTHDDKQLIFNKLHDTFENNLNVWIIHSYNICNLFPNINNNVYTLLTKNEYQKNNALEAYLEKTFFVSDDEESHKFQILKYFMTNLKNTFDNNYILSNVVYYLNCKNNKYLWNIVIPYCDRKDNLLFVLKNLNQMIGNKIEIMISVVEISHENNYYELELDKISNVNYFWIDKKLTGGIFVKCLCTNICHIISSQYYSYDYILWHDVDCIVQSNFYDEIEKVIKHITKNNTVEFDHAIVPYPNKIVLRTDEILAKKIRQCDINVNDISTTTTGICNIIQGSPGGSLLIKTSLFEKIGMFDTSAFYKNCPEDNFILMLIIKYGYMYDVKQNSNQMIHLWHK